MSIPLHFTEEDWARIEKDWTRWWAGELHRPLVMIEEFDSPWKERGIPIHNFGDLVINLPKDWSPDRVLDFFEERLSAKRFYGDAFPKWKLTFGPGVAAGFLGSRVTPTADTVWFDLAEPAKVESLHLKYVADNEWWQRVLALTKRAVERWGDQISIAHTDIGGNFDILASFCSSQQLLVDLYDRPDEVKRAIDDITRVWIRYHDELYAVIRKGKHGTTPWAPIWSPKRCYMLQSDFSYMISPAMFERFILPDLSACCDVLDHGFYHMDGKGQIRHLDLLLSLKRLRGIQWIPGDGAPPPEEWLPLLKRIRDGGKLCQLFVSPDGARKIVQELGGRGFAFYIEQQMSKQEADDFLKQLQSEDKIPWSQGFRR